MRAQHLNHTVPYGAHTTRSQLLSIRLGAFKDPTQANCWVEAGEEKGRRERRDLEKKRGGGSATNTYSGKNGPYWIKRGMQPPTDTKWPASIWPNLKTKDAPGGGAIRPQVLCNQAQVLYGQQVLPVRCWLADNWKQQSQNQQMNKLFFNRMDIWHIFLRTLLMIATKGTLLEREMNKFSNDTRRNANDKVTTKTEQTQSSKCFFFVFCFLQAYIYFNLVRWVSPCHFPQPYCYSLLFIHFSEWWKAALRTDIQFSVSCSSALQHFTACHRFETGEAEVRSGAYRCTHARVRHLAARQRIWDDMLAILKAVMKCSAAVCLI